MFSTKIVRTAGTTLAATTLALGPTACGSDDPAAPTEPTVTSQAVDPAAPPEQVSWQAYQSIDLPTSAVSGPKSISPAASGYQHSPQGAALAAIQTTVRISTAPDNQWAAQVRASVAPGTGRDEFMINRAQLSISPGAPQDEARPTLRGYVMRDYSDERTNVDIITSYSDGSLLSTATHMLWRDGDWKLVLPDPADEVEKQTALNEIPSSMTTLEAP